MKIYATIAKPCQCHAGALPILSPERSDCRFKGRPYEIWQHEMPRRLGYPIKQDGRNQDEQPQNHGPDKGQQVLCHVEKEEWPYKIKKEPDAVNS